MVGQGGEDHQGHDRARTVRGCLTGGLTGLVRTPVVLTGNRAAFAPDWGWRVLFRAVQVGCSLCNRVSRVPSIVFLSTRSLSVCTIKPTLSNLPPKP